jgi:hypothetical protein
LSLLPMKGHEFPSLEKYVVSTQPETTKTRRRAGREQSVLLALPPDAPITLSEVALIAACSLRLVMQERTLGRGPKVYRVGPKTLRSTVGDAIAWVKSREEHRP